MLKILNQKKSINLNGGYAILFTLVIITSILTLGAGMSNVMIKQNLLSSTARESQIAFYQSETAIECGIYAAEVKGLASLSSPWECGLDKDNNPISLNVNNLGNDFYNLSVSLPFAGPCFNVDINKGTSVPSPYIADIKARGYNICDIFDNHQVERGIEVNY